MHSSRAICLFDRSSAISSTISRSRGVRPSCDGGGSRWVLRTATRRSSQTNNVTLAPGDGFLIGDAVTRRNITEIADGLAPELRRKGLIRSGYTHELFRDNLLEY